MKVDKIVTMIVIQTIMIAEVLVKIQSLTSKNKAFLSMIVPNLTTPTQIQTSLSSKKIKQTF